MHSRQSTLRVRPAYTNLRPGRGASNRSVPYKIQGRLLPTRATERRCAGIGRERPGRRPACMNSVAAPIPSSPGIRSSGASFPAPQFRSDYGNSGRPEVVAVSGTPPNACGHMPATAGDAVIEGAAAKAHIASSRAGLAALEARLTWRIVRVALAMPGVATAVVKLVWRRSSPSPISTPLPRASARRGRWRKRMEVRSPGQHSCAAPDGRVIRGLSAGGAGGP